MQLNTDKKNSNKPLSIKVIKILVALLFLVILIPGEKLGMPMGMMILLNLWGVGGIIGFFQSLVLIASEFYLFDSAISKYDNRKDDIIIVSIIVIFFTSIAIFSNNILRYGDTVVYLMLILFSIVSTLCLRAIIKRLTKTKRKYDTLF